MDCGPIRIVDEAAMTGQLDRAIREGLCACFPADVGTFSRTRAWHGSAPAYSALIEAEGRVIAHLGVVDRTISAGGRALRVGGVQNVFVLPEHRGTGLVDRILEAAMQEANRRGLEAGLLFCLPKLEKVYARSGWRTIAPRTVWATRQSGQRYTLDEKNIAMFHALRLEPFPEGEIDLNGDDW